MTIRQELRALADREKAALLARYFKTGKGEYAHGDMFLGLTVPQQRDVARRYRQMPMGEIRGLLTSRFHEYRLVALMILIERYRKADEQARKVIVDFYLKHRRHINNWDLVDLSSHRILGAYLVNHPEERTILYGLARSPGIWDRRIAVISTFAFIARNDFADSLALGEILRKDSHDLIHKAVGWMLREVGKRDRAAEEVFLHKHYQSMPRTMLRYALEKFPPDKREHYMKK